MINLFSLMMLELHVECAMSFGIPCEDHHTAGDLIQTVNDEYLSVFIFKHLHKIFRILFPAIRQNGEAGRFVYNNNMVVYMDNIHLTSTCCKGIDFAFFAMRLCLKLVPKHMIAPPKKNVLKVNRATIKNRMPKRFNSKADTLY